MLHVLVGDFRIKGRCPNLEIPLLLLKNGRTCNNPWTLTYWWYCIQISVFRVHFSHSFKVWGNSIGIESSKNLGLGISTCLPFRWLWGFQFECLNTTRPRLQVQNFESSFKSNCYDFNKKSVLHAINQGQRWGLHHWQPYEQVPLTFTYEGATGKALGMSKAICQPFPSTTWMHQKFIYEPNIYIT